MELSIIIPIFNAEKTLRKTLNAIVAQNIAEMEVLLIDNASIDNSAEICKEFIEKDSRFRYIYEKRNGVSIARNTGLKNALGKYICFCDADDIPNEDMYLVMKNDVIVADSDLVICNYYSERDDLVSSFPSQLRGIIDRAKIENILIPGMFGANNDAVAIWGTVWRCVFKKEIIEKYHLTFDENLSFAEDLCFVLSYLNKIKTVYFESRNLYFYSKTLGSAMLSYNRLKENLLDERIYLIQKIINILEEKELYKKNENCINLVFQQYILDCIGNASVKQDNNSIKTAYLRIKKIVEHPLVQKIFEKIETKNRKERIVFGMIRNKQVFILLMYYRLRKV